MLGRVEGASAVNLLCTTAGDYQSLEFRDEIAAWKEAGHIIELLSLERLATYLHFSPAASLALIDAIVCSTDISLFSWAPGWTPAPNYELTRALRLAEDVRNLPESCAMRDGRKWKAIPFVILSSLGRYSFEMTPEMRQNTHAHILTRYSAFPGRTLRRIRDIVDEYQDRVLDDYRRAGIIIRFEHGRAQIRPALRRKQRCLETEYYCAQANRGDNKGWVTVKRDIDAIRHDVELLQELIDRRANETEMHKFFEEHPAVLMEARLAIPISHKPNFVQPKNWKPDFAFTPILGPELDGGIELMELKGPGERTLSRLRTVHPGFSAKVYSAVDQVRDYDRYLRNPANSQAILHGFGYVPDASRLAVLIGKMPSSDFQREVLERRRSEIDVRVITYDEILESQASHMERIRLS